MSAFFTELCYALQKVTQVAGILNPRYMNELHPKSVQVLWVGLVFLCCHQRSLICHTKSQNQDQKPKHGTTKFGQVYFHELLQNHNDHRPVTKKACRRGRKIHKMNRHSGSSSIFFSLRPREAPAMSNPIKFTQSIQGLFSTINLFRESKWISERWGHISKIEAGAGQCHLVLRSKTVLT